MNYLLLVMKYFPFVLQAITAVEAAIGSAPGATKKQVVMASVTAAAKVGATVDESHVSAISALIETTVGALNASGLLGKPAPAPAK